MKLYDLPRGSKIKTDEGFITFHHLDGMYSYCTADFLPEGENVLHLVAWTPIKEENGIYSIAMEETTA